MKEENNKNTYDPKNIEDKWVKKWEEEKTYQTPSLDKIDKSKPKIHVLDMFPYPSGEGLHTGHTKIFGASDTYARMKRMQGFNVLHATGWDAFGLPAEQYAIKNKVNPKISTSKNTENFERQMKMLGLSYDWSRTVNTTDPNFYKWTQWIFKQLYKKGMCFESFEPINWCPSCKTGLANEDLEDGKCERCGSVVEKKPIRQWVIRITDYADKLLKGVDSLEWRESIKEMQRNWIGESEGAEIIFKLSSNTENGSPYESDFQIFTTRPDTLFGCTYCVFAPEHKLVKEYLDKNLITNKEDVEKYINEAKNKSEIERSAEGKEKTGVKLEGMFAINPANQKQVPIYVADYVLANYGTGAIMAVPAHDERDYEFAKKYNIEIISVIANKLDEKSTVKEESDFLTLVIKNGDKVLVNDKRNNPDTLSEFDFSLVATKMHDKETPLEAMRRELGVNLGVKSFRIGKFLGLYSLEHASKVVNKNLNILNYGVEIEVESGEVKLAQDGSGLRWDSLDTVFAVLNENNMLDQIEILKNSQNTKEIVFSESGILTNSRQFNGMNSVDAKEKITEFVNGKMVKKYKLRDWVFARQRYWGEPFPIVFDEDHNSYVVADSELPVVLPDVESYEPTGTGESPLANIKEFTDVYGYINQDNEFISLKPEDRPSSKDIKVGPQVFRRETNTMPQWAGSSWYWLRYMDPQNSQRLVGSEEEKYWSSNGYSVDMYLGGLEHATRHLIYGRFWNLFLHDIGAITHAEPFKRLEAVGLVLGEGGVKMSKRLGNVVNPDDMVKQFGADTLRLYIAFAASYHDSFSWDVKAIVGPRRFIERVWGLQNKIGEKAFQRGEGWNEVETLLHQTIKKVTEDYEKLQFNTAIAQMMIFVNTIEKFGAISLEDYKILLQLLAPLCPFFTEEIWQKISKPVESIHLSTWPTFDSSKIINKTVNIAVQVNGKLRDVFETATDSTDEIVTNLAKETEGYKKWVGDVVVKKVIIVKNKIVNFII